MPPPQENDEDYVAPKDKAEALARQYEEGTDNAKGGPKAAKDTPSGQSKPKSVHGN